jgi:hypothetical protein
MMEDTLSRAALRIAQEIVGDCWLLRNLNFSTERKVTIQPLPSEPPKFYEVVVQYFLCEEDEDDDAFSSSEIKGDYDFLPVNDEEEEQKDEEPASVVDITLVFAVLTYNDMQQFQQDLAISHAEELRRKGLGNLTGFLTELGPLEPPKSRVNLGLLTAVMTLEMFDELHEGSYYFELTGNALSKLPMFAVEKWMGPKPIPKGQLAEMLQKRYVSCL